MKVAELFVELGIKGQDKTVSALVSVEKGLGGLASMSLEAKAAILGAMYAVEQLFSKSGAQGTALTNLNSELGVSVQTLQQYQYAARQVGVSNEDTVSSFKALQGAMTKMALGEGQPKGFGQVSLLTGSISAQDVNNYMKNPELLLQKLQDYAQKEKRIGVANDALKSFGLSDNMIAAVRRKAFTPDVMKRAPTYSDAEVKSLDKANIAWANLGNTIQMAIGHLNAKYGQLIVKDFTILVNIGLRLAEVFLKIAEKYHLFEKLDKATKHLEQDFDDAMLMAEQLYNQISKLTAGNDIFGDMSRHVEELKESAMPLVTAIEGIGKGLLTIGQNSHIFEHMKNIWGTEFDIMKKFITVLGEVELAMVNVANKYQIFETIGHVLDVFLTTIEHALTGISMMLDVLIEKHVGEKIGTGIAEAGIGIAKAESETGPLKDLGAIMKFISLAGGSESPNNKNNYPNFQATPTVTSSMYGPPSPPQNIHSNNSGNTQHVEVNQTLNFNGTNNAPQDAAHAVKSAVGNAFRQLSSQKQGS